MIKEITNFVETLPAENFSNNLQLKEGLYIFLEIIEGQNGEAILENVDANGNLNSEDYALYDKNSEDSPFFKNCLDIQTNSIPVSPQKIFNPNKKIFGASCSPYVLAFYKKNLEKYNDIKALIQRELADQYFKTAEKFVIEDEDVQNKFRLFRNFLIENLNSFLDSMQEYVDSKDSYSVNIYLKNIDIDVLIESHSKYLGLNVFNKDKYNESYQNELLGVSDSLSGFNDKKIFLQHKSALSGVSYRVGQKEAQLLWKFFQMQSNRQLPNPLPIFVDQEEDLNKATVKLHQSGKALGYTEIVKQLATLKDSNLQNFYLIFFDPRGKKSKIMDIDFVPLFNYKIEGLIIKEIFDLKGAFETTITDVFQLQYEVFNKIFNGHLVSERKDGGLWLKYFDDIDTNPKYGLTDAIVHLMHQYRKAFYDYIYKSRHQAITCKMFDDMVIKSILDDIRHDEEFNKHNKIKEKLNIWFNLFDFFSQNQNRINMANKTLELRESLKKISVNEDQYIQSDDEFAFASGQIMWKILVQSKSSNKSHALLEPFLQKTDAIEFKKAIARSFDTYKHEFKFYPTKYAFDKLMSEVMGYEPSEKNMKNHLPMILAGYFSNSLFKQEKEIDNQ
jgi:CRISPR-associated protein Csh1